MTAVVTGSQDAEGQAAGNDNGRAGKLSRLPVWTPIDTGTDVVYDALDSRERAWRMWYVDEPSSEDPFPAGWRFAPVDTLDQPNFIAKVGGLREFDLAAIRIDAFAAHDSGLRYRMGHEEPTGHAPPFLDDREQGIDDE